MTDRDMTIVEPSADTGNPFVVDSPERLTPKRMVQLFVEEYTQIGVAKQRKHTFIWGSRGSGKSMMLRYLEPECQSLVHGGDGKYLSKEPYLGVYCPCKEGQFNKTELLLLNRGPLLIITEHLINLAIADTLLNCLRTQFPPSFLPKSEREGFVDEVLDLFDRASIASSLEVIREKTSDYDDPLKQLQALFSVEKRKVGAFLRVSALEGISARYSGATSGYHDFLLPMFRAVQHFSSLASVPAYILIDDADRLTADQQSIINSWVANRDQATICLKVSAQREGYKTFMTRDGLMIENPHDYSEIDVDELYTQSKTDYAEKVRRIANRRLNLSSLPTKDIVAFLPDNPREHLLFEEVKRETAREWESVGKPGRQGDYVTRYAMARLFQRLGKSHKSYAGFQNLVHLSSGVVRGFLDPCYLMFEEYVSREQKRELIALIPPGIQDFIIYKWSKDFLLEKFEDIRKGLPPERWSTLESLRTLVESLGRLFYQRLHNPKSREARLFSFTVRGSVPDRIEEVLRLGVKYRYFQLKTYSTKEGGGRERWYVLNRRLCPSYKLDPTGFEGRVSLTPEMLELACNDPDQFVRDRLKREAGQEMGQETLVPFQEVAPEDLIVEWS